MIQTLFDLSLSAVCRNRIRIDLSYMPTNCKQRVLEFLASHDKLSLQDSGDLVRFPLFGMNLTTIHFYLSEEVTDSHLLQLTEYNKFLERVTLIECRRVTDEGIRNVTKAQFNLRTLELRAMTQITDASLTAIRSPYLRVVDLSGCKQLTSDGLRELFSWNRNIEALFLNHCTNLDEMIFYHIAYYLAPNLAVLELDFLNSIPDSPSALAHLSSSCSNLKQLSLARFFQDEEMLETNPYRIDSGSLQNVDLYGNFFTTLPQLPPTLTYLRLSVSGEEHTANLIQSLETLPFLRTIDLIVACREESLQAIDNANNLLCQALPFIGRYINFIQISVARMFEPTLRSVMENCPNLRHLALDVKHMNNLPFVRFFTSQAGAKLQTLKMCKMRLSYRVLFAIARGARNLRELETSYMACVDDRFLMLLASNCRFLRTANFNGCRFVTDKGMAPLAKKCPLREVRIRATSCTDKSLQVLGKFCPQLEWISYADYSGRPRFSDEAIQQLKDACMHKLIC